MRTKRFNLDLSQPFGSITQLYQNLGIMEVLHEEAQRRELDPHIKFPPEAIRCNQETQRRIIKQWQYNWRNYNYDRRTGLPKRGELKKYARPHSLSYNEARTIEWTFYLGDGPSCNDDLPDDVLELNLDFTIREVENLYGN